MKCKRYQPWLTDKALGTLDARRDPELAAQVAACSGCRAALDREQILFAAIHRGVTKSVAASPSAEMAVRIRRRVATEAAAEHVWQFDSRRWIPVAAAALLIALASLWLIHRRTFERVEATKSAAAKPAPSIAHPLPAVAGEGGEGVEPKPGAAPVNRAETARVATRRGEARLPRTSTAEPEVLVDKEEAVLVLQLYYSANPFPVNHSVSAHLSAAPERDADGNLAALEIPPLQIAALEPTPGPDPDGKASAEDRPDDVQR
ncbi:MAG: hypothetical protein ACLQOO_33300 [Terriglobia bacterium]